METWIKPTHHTHNAMESITSLRMTMPENRIFTSYIPKALPLLFGGFDGDDLFLQFRVIVRIVQILAVCTNNSHKINGLREPRQRDIQESVNPYWASLCALQPPDSAWKVRSPQLRRIALHPAQDRRVYERQSAFSHHLDKIPETEFVAQVPADTQNDDLAIKVSPIEQLVRLFSLLIGDQQFIPSHTLTDCTSPFAPVPYRRDSRQISPTVSKILVNRLNGGCPFSHGGRHSLDGATAHVAC